MLGTKRSCLTSLAASTKAHQAALVPVPSSKCAYANPLAFVPCVFSISSAGRSHRLTENGWPSQIEPKPPIISFSICICLFSSRRLLLESSAIPLRDASPRLGVAACVVSLNNPALPTPIGFPPQLNRGIPPVVVSAVTQHKSALNSTASSLRRCPSPLTARQSSAQDRQCPCDFRARALSVRIRTLLECGQQ